MVATNSSRCPRSTRRARFRRVWPRLPRSPRRLSRTVRRRRGPPATRWSPFKTPRTHSTRPHPRPDRADLRPVRRVRGLGRHFSGHVGAASCAVVGQNTSDGTPWRRIAATNASATARPGRHRQDGRGDDVAGMVVDPGQYLALVPAGEVDTANEVHLPQALRAASSCTCACGAGPAVGRIRCVPTHGAPLFVTGPVVCRAA